MFRVSPSGMSGASSREASSSSSEVIGVSARLGFAMHAASRSTGGVVGPDPALSGITGVTGSRRAMGRADVDRLMKGCPGAGRASRVARGDRG